MIRIFNEDPSSPITYAFDVHDVVARETSAFQEILIVDTPGLGRVLLLDGAVQYATRDEFFYHEMAAHVPLTAHPEPRRVAVIGGGDGGVLREVLKHETVREVLVAEIDEKMIEMAGAHLPGARAAFDDPRTQVRILDGAEFVQDPPGLFDLLIVDGGDYTGFARNMLTAAFVRAASDCLEKDGVFVSHSGSLHFHRPLLAGMQALLEEVFPVVDLYTTSLPSFPGNWWSFSAGSKGPALREPLRDPPPDCRFYDPEVHRHAFLPESLRRRLRRGELDGRTPRSPA